MSLSGKAPQESETEGAEVEADADMMRVRKRAKEGRMRRLSGALWCDSGFAMEVD